MENVPFEDPVKILVDISEIINELEAVRNSLGIMDFNYSVLLKHAITGVMVEAYMDDGCDMASYFMMEEVLKSVELHEDDKNHLKTMFLKAMKDLYHKFLDVGAYWEGILYYQFDKLTKANLLILKQEPVEA